MTDSNKCVNLFVYCEVKLGCIMKKYYTLLMLLFCLNNLIMAQNYCTPTYTGGGQLSRFYTHLLNVTFGEINFNSSAPWTLYPDVIYQDYTNYSTGTTDVVPNHSYPISISVGNGANTQDVTAWIDFNQNKVFESSERLFTVRDYENTGDHIIRKTVNIPVNAVLGVTRLRVCTQSASANPPDPCVSSVTVQGGTPPTNVSSVHYQDFKVVIRQPDIQKYISSACYHEITDEVVAGTTNNQILRILINTNTDGSLSPLGTDTFYFSTLGSTNPAEIVNAKLYYSGKSPEFNTTKQVGSTVSNPSTMFKIATTQKLEPGNNYFWLTYDIASNAILGNVVDARFNGVHIISRRFPTIFDPSGSRRIGYCISKGKQSQFVYTRRVTLGSINNGIQYYSGTGYSDYTYLTTNLFKGHFHNLSVETGNGVNPNYVRAWIDFNRDGVFDNTSERVLFDSIMPVAPNTSYGPVMDSFEIPLNAPVGATRMRVTSHFRGQTGSLRIPALPCENPVDVGEIEDYNIIIADSGQTVAEFGSNITCFGSPTVFTDKSYTFGTQYKVSSWIWEFGDGDTSHAQNPTHTYKNPGIYNVKLTAKTNSPSAINGTVTKTVIVNKPEANFSWNSYQWKNPVTFLDETTGGITTSWYWDFGDPLSGFNNFSNSKNPSHIYDTTGFFTITFIATVQGGCKDTIKKTILIDSVISPVADYSASNYNPYFNQDVSFQDQTVNNPKTWKWTISPTYYKFKNGTGNNSQNPVISFDSIRTYNVKLVVTNSRGADSVTKVITVKNYSKPISEFSALPLSAKAGQLVSFLDESKNDPNQWVWSFGDKDSATVQHPNHVYLTTGNYTVSLQAINPAGNDTKIKTNYIKVTNEYTICDNDAPKSDLFSGFIFDSGGNAGNYKNGTQCGFLIQPNCAGPITLNFYFLDYAPGDYLRVFDGTDNKGKPLFSGDGFTGSVKPNSVTAFSGSMYIEEVTDATNNATGFSAAWSALPNFKPKAVIEADTVGYLNGPVTFFNKTVIGTNNKYKWDYDNDGKYDDSTHINGNYKFTTLGYHTVVLLAENCAGATTTNFKIKIIMPTKAPVADFTSDKDTVSEGEKVQFYDLSTNGPNRWKWEIKFYDYWSAYYFTDGTTDTSQNPVIEFYGIDAFDIKLTSSNNIGTSQPITKKKEIVTIAKAQMGAWPFEQDAGAGRLFDGGGPSGDYLNNENYALLLKPCGEKVYLKFSKFDFASGDFLRVYDGKDNTGKPLHTGSGFTFGVPPSFTVPLVAESGYMYIEEVTNGITTASGFVADWYVKPVAPPKASFTHPDTTYTGGAYTYFTNSSTGRIDKCYWDYDYDGIMDDSNYNGIFKYTIPKQQFVYLKVVNCADEHAFSSDFKVIDPFRIPKTEFLADRLNADTSDIVQLKDLSKYGPNTWNWKFIPQNATIISPEGSNYPVVSTKFSKTGKYDVELKTSNSFGSDSLIKNGYLNIFAYCRPNVSNLQTNWGILRVVLNKLDNSTEAGKTGYTDYSATKSTSLELGGKYQFTVYSFNLPYSFSKKIWIDYNQDGVFTEPDELAANINSQQSAQWTGNITVPSSALLGNTRMRVSYNYTGYPHTPCGPNQFGEIEDYRIIITQDMTPPVIMLKGFEPTLTELSYPYIDSGASAIDAVDGDVSANLVITSNVNINKVGKYEVKYNVKDSKGNMANEEIRTVFVTPDKTKPVITLKGSNPMIMGVFGKYLEPGATAVDNIDGDVTANIVIQNLIDSSRVDTFSVNYTVYDKNGNFSDPVTRTVYVVDTIPPVITLIGPDTLIVPLGGPLNDPGTIVTDNYYTGVNAVSADNVSINKNGWYWIRYNATDPSGNKAKIVERTVKVGTPDAITDVENGNNVLIFPNPSNGLFNIDIDLIKAQNVNICIVNSLGKIIYQNKYSNIKNKISEVDLTDIAEGVYFISVITEESIFTNKVTIVK